MGAGLSCALAVPSLVLPDRLMLEEEPAQPAEPRMPCRGCSLHHSMRACSFHHSFHSSSRSHLCLRVRVCACLCVSVCVCAKRGVWVGGRGAVADIEWPILNGRYRMADIECPHVTLQAPLPACVCSRGVCWRAAGGLRPTRTFANIQNTRRSMHLCRQRAGLERASLSALAAGHM